MVLDLLRAQTAAAGIAVNAQLRADEKVRRSDVLKKLLARIAEERARMAEHERLKREEREGFVSSGSE